MKPKPEKGGLPAIIPKAPAEPSPSLDLLEPPLDFIKIAAVLERLAARVALLEGRFRRVKLKLDEIEEEKMRPIGDSNEQQARDALETVAIIVRQEVTRAMQTEKENQKGESGNAE